MTKNTNSTAKTDTCTTLFLFGLVLGFVCAWRLQHLRNIEEI